MKKRSRLFLFLAVVLLSCVPLSCAGGGYVSVGVSVPVGPYPYGGPGIYVGGPVYVW